MSEPRIFRVTGYPKTDRTLANTIELVDVSAEAARMRVAAMAQCDPARLRVEEL